MKKVLVSLIIGIMLLVLFMPNVKATTQATTTQATITGTTTTVEKGKEITLVLGVNNIDIQKGICEFKGKLEYDKNVFTKAYVLEYTDASWTIAQKVTNVWKTPTYVEANGIIGCERNEFVTSNTKIFTITLVPASTLTPGTTTVKISEIEVGNSSDKETLSDASITLTIPNTNEPQNTTKPTADKKIETVTEGIKVTLTSTSELKAIEGWTLSTDKKVLTKTYTTSFNGTVTIEDIDGNKSDAIPINVNITPVINIDTTKPTGVVKCTNGTNSVTVTITANEAVQALDGWTLSTDKKTLTKTYAANYEGKVNIVDLAGNKSDDIKISVTMPTTKESNTNKDSGSSTNKDSNSSSNASSSSNKSSSSTPSTLPKAGVEDYILPIIAIIAFSGAIAYIKFKKIDF